MLAGTVKQDEAKKGHCFGMSAAASADGLGNMVIGLNTSPETGEQVWHAVVQPADGATYDPTMRQWFEPGVYEQSGFSPRLVLTPEQVRAFVQQNDGLAPDAQNQGLVSGEPAQPATAFTPTQTTQGVVRETLDGRRYYDHFEVTGPSPGGISGDRSGSGSHQPAPGEGSATGIADARSVAQPSTTSKSTILTSSGKPFQTKGAAVLASRGRSDLKGRDLVPVEVEGGWGLVERNAKSAEVSSSVADHFADASNMVAQGKETAPALTSEQPKERKVTEADIRAPEKSKESVPAKEASPDKKADISEASILENAATTRRTKDEYLSYLNGRMGRDWVRENREVVDAAWDRVANEPATAGQEGSGVPQNTIQADDARASEILDRANVTGKERLDIIKDFRAGAVTLADLESAYPASVSQNAESDTQPSLSATDDAQEPTATDGKMEGRLSAGKFERFAQLGDESASLEQTLDDVERIMGFRSPFDVVVDTSLGDKVPMSFDPSRRLVLVNTDVPMTRSEAAQYMVEEVMHGIDAVKPNRTISASSKLFDRGGAIREEAQSRFDDGSIAEFLTYPLNRTLHSGLSESAVEAELFARLGVLYLGDPTAMQELMPNAYRAYQEVFGLERESPVTGAFVFRKVWGERAAKRGQVRGEHGAGAEVGGDGARADQEGRAGEGLGRIRKAFSGTLEGDPLGARIQNRRFNTGPRQEAGVLRSAREDGKPSVFSLDRNDGPKGRVFTVAQTEQAVAGILRGVGLPADAITVVNTFADLPADIQADAKAQQAEGKTKGVLHKSGSIYVVADKHTSEADIQETALHELMGHKGIRALFGKDYVRGMNKLFLQLGGWSGVKKVAKGRGLASEIDSYRKALFGANRPEWAHDMRVAILTDELVAAIAQKSKVLDQFKAVIGAIRQWLREHGFAKLANYGETDLLRVLQQGRKALFDRANAPGETVFMVDAIGSGGRSGEDFATEVLTELATVDDLFRYPVSHKTSLSGVFRDVVPGTEYLGEDTRADERDESQADRRFAFKSPHGKLFYVYERGPDEVWIDVSSLTEGEGGSGIYAAVANYAHNTGKVFIGDPNGLSEAAVVRRTSNMLSSALRFGTTRHLEAAPEQVRGNPERGIEPLRMAGTDIERTRALIHTFLTTLQNQFPRLNDYRYDFTRARFVGPDGREVARVSDVAGNRPGDDGRDPRNAVGNGRDLPDGRSGFGEVLADPDARESRIGEASLRRGILLKSIVESADGQRPGILEQVLTRAHSLVTEGGLDRLFSRTQGPRPSAGVSVSEMVESLKAALPGQAKAIDRMLERGKREQKGGLVIVDVVPKGDDMRMSSEIFADEFALFTDRDFNDDNVLKIAVSRDNEVQGVYDRRTGIIFMSGALSPEAAPAVLLHEATHGQHREGLNQTAVNLIQNRATLPISNKTRAFLDRVWVRIKNAQNEDESSEYVAYIVEQAAREGRESGHVEMGAKFIEWASANLGKPIGDLVHKFLTMVRSWGLKHGTPINLTTDDVVNGLVDHMVALAKGDIERAAAGDVQTIPAAGAKTGKSWRDNPAVQRLRELNGRRKYDEEKVQTWRPYLTPDEYAEALELDARFDFDGLNYLDIRRHEALQNKAWETWTNEVSALDAEVNALMDGMPDATQEKVIAYANMSVAEVSDAEVRALVEQYAGVDGAPTEAEIAESVQQYRDTERAYGGREAYEKAKSDGNTNLNYRQWVQVRTPNFKRWFGNWLGARAFNEMSGMAPVQVRGLPVDIGGQALREAANEAYAQAAKDGLVTTQDGRRVSLTQVGLKKTRHHSADRRVLDLMPSIRELLGKAVPIASLPHDMANPGDSIRAWHHYGAKVRLGGQEFYAKLVVRESVNGEIYYDSDLSSVEEIGGRDVDATPPKAGAAPVSADKNSLADLLAGARSSSKVTDPGTGEPLVVYHGTDGEFTSFDLREVRQNADIPSFYFAKNEIEGGGVDGLEAESASQSPRNAGSGFSVSGSSLSLMTAASACDSFRNLRLPGPFQVRQRPLFAGRSLRAGAQATVKFASSVLQRLALTRRAIARLRSALLMLSRSVTCPTIRLGHEV